MIYIDLDASVMRPLKRNSSPADLMHSPISKSEHSARVRPGLPGSARVRPGPPGSARVRPGPPGSARVRPESVLSPGSILITHRIF